MENWKKAGTLSFFHDELQKYSYHGAMRIQSSSESSHSMIECLGYGQDSTTGKNSLIIKHLL